MIFDAYCTPGTERDTLLPVDELLRQMDAADIAKAIIAPEDRELAVANAAGNERMLRHASLHPDRLVPACGVNPWFRSAAVAEFERRVHQGARMLVLAPALQGFIPTDSVADELCDCAGRLNVPVYIHTGPHSSGGPTQIVLQGEKHAATRFILGHCGSTDHAWDMLTILRNHKLPNVWYELSFVRPWVVPNYLELAGSSRLIWGSGSPRNDAQVELEQLSRFVSQCDHADIYFNNLESLISEVRSSHD